MQVTSPLLPSSRASSGRRASRLGPARSGVGAVLAMVALMWVLWIIDALDSYRLNPEYGIRPRNVSHLYDILIAPFLHGSFGHIFGNTIPFLILGLVIAGSGVGRVIGVTLISIVISGLGVWLTAGSHSFTVGASGVVFGFAAYLVARGVFTRRLIDLAVGLIVGALFGLSLLSDLIPRSGVSWQGHLFGAIAGVIAAALLSSRTEHRRPNSRGRAGTARPRLG